MSQGVHHRACQQPERTGHTTCCFRSYPHRSTEWRNGVDRMRKERGTVDRHAEF